MKVTIVSLNEDTIRFILQGVDVAFANALRRTMISEVPTMTVEDIFYFDNTSITPDEIVAHRTGLIPIRTDLDTYILPDKCDCNAELGCPKCRAVLTLDVEAKDDTITVYSGDLVPEDPETIPTDPKIPITKLAPKQAIRFEAYAQLGQGKDHAKWSPVSMCVYQNVSVMNIENKEMAKKCIEVCGKEAATLNGNKLKVIDIQKFESCSICRDLVSHELIMDNLKPDEFLFTVESTGALSPKRIVIEAVKVLNEKLDEVIAKIDSDDIHDEITDFETPEQKSSRLHGLDLGEITDEEEENQE